MKRLIAVVFLIFASSPIALAQVAVIAHKTVPADSLSQAQLRDLYAYDVKFWSNKKPVIVFDLRPPSEVKDEFYKFLGKSPSRMKSIWLKKLLLGEGEPPEALSSEEEIVKKVAATPGALGFVSKAKAGDGVKIVLIIEKSEK